MSLLFAANPVKPWDGVKDAIIYGPVCPELMTVQPSDNYTVPHVFYPQDEDCQYLNVWTQKPEPDRKRPVLVWLHGGGFSTGSGIEHFAYDGENMSRFGDVVVVTLNHRLNLLGFLDLSKYGEQYRYSGNADYIEPSYIPGITEKLQSEVCGCWCSFAETGRPSAAGLPEWMPFTADSHEMMYFDVESAVKCADAEEKLAEFLEKHPFEMKAADCSVQAKYFGGGPRV